MRYIYGLFSRLNCNNEYAIKTPKKQKPLTTSDAENLPIRSTSPMKGRTLSILEGAEFELAGMDAAITLGV